MAIATAFMEITELKQIPWEKIHFNHTLKQKQEWLHKPGEYLQDCTINYTTFMRGWKTVGKDSNVGPYLNSKVEFIIQNVAETAKFNQL